MHNAGIYVLRDKLVPVIGIQWAQTLASVINSCQITVTGLVYAKVSAGLTHRENHRWANTAVCYCPPATAAVFATHNYFYHSSCLNPMVLRYLSWLTLSILYIYCWMLFSFELCGVGCARFIRRW